MFRNRKEHAIINHIFVPLINFILLAMTPVLFLDLSVFILFAYQFSHLSRPLVQKIQTHSIDLSVVPSNWKQFLFALSLLKISSFVLSKLASTLVLSVTQLSLFNASYNKSESSGNKKTSAEYYNKLNCTSLSYTPLKFKYKKIFDFILGN